MSQREDLLAGAKKCLIDKGYSRTTARDIAAVSGAHLASIGYHFGSKDNLMNTAVLAAVEEWGDKIEAAVDAADAVTPEQRLEVFLDGLFAAVERDRELMAASVQAYAQAQFEDALREPLAEAYARGRRTLAAMVLGVRPEEVDEEAAGSVGATVHSMIAGFVLQSLLAPGSLPSAARVSAALRVLAGAHG
ncbi:TetR/AcrR family transcriptional regulator [Sinosporangium siamense]|uniref:TetR family transcriptional regulator n=1 Tax=Sinosporangium siamense TaxID=1367973 RepID=A0A919RNU8_9ACTN|nr:TetR family transcriptional regulator C-terminal domain-containing protein [Sinosporangium siamense]GII97207.1 TetR family transcriptional regulator [Sinosporangium siamense]